MKKLNYILAFTFLTIGIYVNAQSTYSDRMLSFSNSSTASRQHADSVMSIVIAKASYYATSISKYNAEIYIKGQAEILKKNVLIRFAHHIFPVDRKTDNMMLEMISESEFEAPNNFQYSFKAVNGNSIPNPKKQQEVMTFLNMNVYSQFIYNDAIIMPIARNAPRFYNYNLEDIEEHNGAKVYKIRFMPKQWSQKLISGDMWVQEDTWNIVGINFNGRLEFAQFNVKMKFSNDFRKFTLPEQADLNLRYQVLGNVIECNYHTSFNFKEVEWITENHEKKQRKPLDLTRYYTLSNTPIPFIQDSIYWQNKRDIPLTEEESKLLLHFTEKKENSDSTNITKYLDITEQLTNTMSFDILNSRVRYSGILNPLQLGYSARNGITYKQQLRINRTLSNGKTLYTRPEIGYIFKRKEVFYKLYSEWLYKPEKKGGLSILVANGNTGYSSQMMDAINQHLKDSIFSFKDLDLEYFRHYYGTLKNEIELAHGLLLSTSATYHRRVPIKKRLSVDPGDDVEDLIEDKHIAFEPSINISYTPRQFYRMRGRKKEYVYSYFPTFSLEFAHAIPDVLKSTGKYSRVELDIHQTLPLGSLQRINYHASGGIYFNAKSTYFADFTYFARSNFPDSWSNRIGGVFHLLNRNWFNASDKYVQTHIMYESPFILLHLSQKEASKHVLSERIYLGQLWTPALPSYTEVGYGIGNHLFNIAVFAGFERWEYKSIGFKFAFELFQ